MEDDDEDDDESSEEEADEEEQMEGAGESSPGNAEGATDEEAAFDDR